MVLGLTLSSKEMQQNIVSYRFQGFQDEAPPITNWYHFVYAWLLHKDES